MADSFVQLPADGPGKKLDTDNLTVGADSVHRERMQLAGDAAAAITKILNTDPTGSEYGLVTRIIQAKSPQISVVSAASVAPGASTTLDSAQITTGKTGKLLRLIATASVPFKVVLRTVSNGAASSDKAIAFSSWDRTVVIDPPARDFWTVAHDAAAGFDGFRAVLTNLDTGPNAADLYVTFLFDEI
jgi:hypothetical protein